MLLSPVSVERQMAGEAVRLSKSPEHGLIEYIICIMSSAWVKRIQLWGGHCRCFCVRVLFNA